MRKSMRLLSVMSALMLFGAAAMARDVTVIDLNGNSMPTVVGGDKSVYVTNTNTGLKSDTIASLTVDTDGKLYIGMVGKDNTTFDPGNYSVANGEITLNVTNDMTIGGATWIGKWDMSSGANIFYQSFFPEFGGAATGKINVDVGGNLLVNSTLYAAADGTASATNIDVTGNTIITSGGNHFVAYNGASLVLKTETFQLDGGEIEVIGSYATGYNNKTQVITRATSGTAVHLNNDAELTIMRGALFDLSAGGDFVVENGSLLVGGSDGGEIQLSNGGELTIDATSGLYMKRGSLKVTGTGSSAILNGTITLGFYPSTDVPASSPNGGEFTSFTGVNVTVGSSAAFAIENEFIKKALSTYTSTLTDANAVVIEGTSSLTYAPETWTSGDKTLVENYYGKFVFTRSGDQILFKHVDASHFSDSASATSAMGSQISQVYSANNIDARNIPQGLAQNAAGAAQSISGVSTPGLAAVASDGSGAGALNLSMLQSLASGSGSFSGGGVSGQFNTAFANILNANRSSNVTAVSMGVTGQVNNSISGRIADNNAALAQVREETGSDYALASRILNCNYMNRVWIGGLGMWEDADTRKGMSGYKYDSYGVIAGYDRVFGAITAGAAFGYNSGDYKDKAATAHDSDIENYAFSLYATYNHQSGFFASVMGGYTYSDNDINEFDGAQWGREDFHTDTWNIGAKFGYDWKPIPCLTLTPSVGVNYVHAKNSDHDVNYGGVSLLRYDSMKNHSTSLPVELAASYDIVTGDDSKLTLNGNVGYSYNFHDDGVDGNIFMNGLSSGTALRATGREAGKHTFNVGAGVRYTCNRFDFGVKYDYYGKADYDAHRVMGTVGISF